MGGRSTGNTAPASRAQAARPSGSARPGCRAAAQLACGRPSALPAPPGCRPARTLYLAVSAAASACSRSRRRATSTRRQPASARRHAVASPKPALAPGPIIREWDRAGGGWARVGWRNACVGRGGWGACEAGLGCCCGVVAGSPVTRATWPRMSYGLYSSDGRLMAAAAVVVGGGGGGVGVRLLAERPVGGVCCCCCCCSGCDGCVVSGCSCARGGRGRSPPTRLWVRCE